MRGFGKDINGSDKYPGSRTAGRKFEPFLEKMDKLSIQEQILVGYAIREAAYDMGLLAEKPKSLKEDTQDFCKEWIDEWKRQNNKDE